MQKKASKTNVDNSASCFFLFKKVHEQKMKNGDAGFAYG